MGTDPIRLSLVQNQLDHITKQMGWVMMQTARSPIFSISHDFSCFLTSADGVLVANADGIPVHTGGGGFAVRALLASFGNEIALGDIFVLNDPYLAGGNHLPDYVIARPVFVRDRIVGFACNRAHQIDIGGGAAGTYNPLATEIFHEGLRIPPLRLAERGVIRKDIWNLLLANCRLPHAMGGDLSAMLGSTQIGAEQMAALFEDGDIEEAVSVIEEVLAYAEKRMRVAIAALPDGEYWGHERTSSDCFDDLETIYRVKMTKAGDSLSFDFTGTGSQTKGFKNSSLSNTYSSVYLAVASFLDPDLPRNEGAFRAISITAPEGTVVNPLPPAAVTMCTTTPAHEIVHVCWMALSTADRSRAVAGWGKPMHPTTSGMGRDGQKFVMYHWNGTPGAGATVRRDGFNQMGQLPTLGGLLLPNVEDYEQLYPVIIHRHELRSDGGGAGKFRGGTGVEYVVEVAVDGQYSLRGEGIGELTGFGVEGATDGASSRLSMMANDGHVIDLPKWGLRDLPSGTIHIYSAGGGGFGDPLDRDVHAVLSDVRDCIVSRAAATEIYGVVFDEDVISVDFQKTEACRSALSVARKRNQQAGHAA